METGVTLVGRDRSEEAGSGTKIWIGLGFWKGGDDGGGSSTPWRGFVSFSGKALGPAAFVERVGLLRGKKAERWSEEEGGLVNVPRERAHGPNWR